MHPSFVRVRAAASRATFWLLLVLSPACERTNQESVARAVAHATSLVEVAQRDLGEVRKGLPQGAQELGKRWSAAGADLTNDPEAAREALNYARNKVQDLRVAKSTFFALATPAGKVVRNDREQDLMAGAALFTAFPSLEKAAQGAYVEALGVLPEAHGVKGKPDAEWMAATGVSVGGEVRGLMVTGWAWSSYAFRLEFSLRNRITSELKGKQENVPLVYAFVIVGDEVYGSPESPEVNARAIAERKPLSNLAADGAFSTLLEITGRQFALGIRALPDLAGAAAAAPSGAAPAVGIGVLRSEI
jgi:hypothetical protein